MASQLAGKTGYAAPSTDRIALFGEILTVLEQVALKQRLLLVFEDLHWADEHTRDLLTFLVANLAEGEVNILGTYRPAEAGPLRSLVAELHRHPGTRLVSPAPLNRHEVGRLLAALLGSEPNKAVISRVFDRSGGNPLFVEALSRSPEDTPAGLTELLLGFRVGLPADAQTILTLASACGSGVRHELLSDAALLSFEDLVTALRMLIDLQLLRAEATGYEFRHVLIRQAIYDDLLPAQRVDVHQRLARALSDKDYPAEMAHHAAAAGDYQLAATASWRAAVIAGDIGAHAERLRQLERVMDLWDRVPRLAELLDTTPASVLEQIVDAASHSGAIGHGIEAATAAIALVDPQAEPLRAAALYQRRAGLKGRTGQGPGADLEAALALTSAKQSTIERGEALAQRAITRVFGGESVAAEADARAAVDIAEQLGATDLAARAYSYLALATGDHPDLAGTYFAKAHAFAGDQSPEVATWESAMLLNAGQLHEAISVIQRALRGAHATYRFGELAPIMLVRWARALVALGEWSQALSLVDDAQFLQLTPLSRAALLQCYAEIALSQGDATTARGHLSDAEGLLGEGRWAEPYRIKQQALECQLALDLGDHPAAARALAQSEPDVWVRHPHETWPLVLLAVQVTGAPTELLTLAEKLPAVTSPTAAYHATYRATTEGTASRWEDAASSWRALKRPYDQAHSLVAVAQVHALAGDRVAAETALRTAAALATKLGAVPLASTVHKVARRARITLDPQASAPAPATSTLGLTVRELDVLGLVAKGYSNRRIATELFISANTVGVHVSRILGKLGVATRTEAAAVAYERQLFD
ncbi:LuxR C-terminal-related transcriptional regulator [Arthrobacter sp. UYCu723]